jgi:hypothetical protein
MAKAYSVQADKYLEHFDLASGHMESFGRSVTVAVRVSFHLNAERDSLLSAVFLRCKFSADAVHL